MAAFGLSCVDIVRPTGFAVDLFNCTRYESSTSSRQSMQQLLAELAIIAKAIEKVTTPLDVYFLSEDEVPLQHAELSLETLHRCLGKPWWPDDNAAVPCCPAPFLSNLKYMAERLRRDLEQKARKRRLILVCQRLRGALLKEALTGKSSPNHGKWLLDRIAGIVFLDIIPFCDQSRWKLSLSDLKDHHDSRPPNGESHALPSWVPQYFRTGHELEDLPGSIHTITVRLGKLPSILARQFHSSNLRRSQRSSLDACKKQVMEVQCSLEDFADCRLWSVIRLVEGERWGRPGIDALTSHLNYEALFQRLNMMIKAALDQASPSRKHMVLKILNWTAWSMRPLESQEMLAALATYTDLDIFSRNAPRSNENVWPMTDEELISFCPDLLEIKAGRQVVFRDEHLGSLIRSPSSTGLGFAPAEAAHESLAAVCFHHLRCFHRETILRPWIGTGPMLKGEIRFCHFRSYCTNHWQDHYRAAETRSRKLVGMLHRTIEAACDARTVSNGLKDANSVFPMSTGMWVCSLWDLKILGRTYLEMGADFNFCSGPDEAPLHIAAANCSTNMLRLLLDRGANPNVRDKSGFTVLQQACRAGTLDVATLLLQKGADPESSHSPSQGFVSQAPGSNWTPLHLAATHDYSDIVKALLEAGSNPQASTPDSRSTALHLAAEHGNEDAVRYLIKWGVDLEAENARAETALQIAEHEWHEAIVKILVKKGAKRALNTAEDMVSLDKALDNRTIASTVQYIRHVSFKGTNISPSEDNTACLYRSTSPILATSTSYARFDDTFGCAAEAGWTIVDRTDLEA